VKKKPKKNLLDRQKKFLTNELNNGSSPAKKSPTTQSLPGQSSTTSNVTPTTSSEPIVDQQETHQQLIELFCKLGYKVTDPSGFTFSKTANTPMQNKVPEKIHLFFCSRTVQGVFIS